MELGLPDGINTIFTEKKIVAGFSEESIKNSVEQWTRQGGDHEDNAARWLNHFHDPLKPWDEAGLALVLTCDSCLLWAQRTDIIDTFPFNEYSWIAARRYYYNALKTGDEASWALTFRSLGQVMHLVSDMAVPAHARNDRHPCGEPFESYVTRNLNSIPDYLRNYPATSVDPNPAPADPKPDPAIFKRAVRNPLAPVPISALWDQDVYHAGDEPPQGFVGLAEYTNANFWSSDTQYLYGTSRYPHPSVDDTNFSSIDWSHPEEFPTANGVEHKIYLYDNKATPSYRLGAASYFMLDSPDPYGDIDFGYLYVLDDKVYEDYAKLLVPRAAGYSAALLDYFFRGKIAVRKLSLTRDDDANITGMGLEIKNSPRSGQEPEAMKGGYIELSYRYIPPGETESVVTLLKDSIYPVSGESDQINSSYVPLTGLPVRIPYGAKDIAVTLVYRGALGDEEDAIVGRVIPFASRIAYSGHTACAEDNGFIGTIHPDGTDDINFTEALGPASPSGAEYVWRQYPTWSPDGKRMAFNAITREENPFSEEPIYHDDVAVVDLTSNRPYPENIERIFHHPDWHYIHPSFSPDGSKLAVYRLRVHHPFDDTDVYESLAVLDVNSGEWSYVCDMQTWTANFHILDSPRWSPKGDEIAFQGISWGNNPEGNRSIRKVNLASKQITTLTEDRHDSLSPSWSPDGQKIVFSSKREGSQQFNIWIMDRTGANQTLLAASPWSGIMDAPSFSADGNMIAFGDEAGNLFTVNADGSNLSPITGDENCRGTVAWSPYILSPEVDLSANPGSIASGSSSTLTWDAGNAFSCSIEPDVGKVAPSGSKVVAPTQTTTYTITAKGPLGTATSTVKVTVTAQ